MKILYGAKMVFTRSAIAYNSAERQCLFYSPVVWGGANQTLGELLLEVWGLCPQRDPGEEPLVRGPGAKSPRS